SGLCLVPRGAIIPDAAITITNMTTGNTTFLRTDQQGGFHAKSLPTGIYKVSVRSPGFNSAENSFQLEARDRAEITARLQLGSTTETVEVSGSSVVLSPDVVSMSFANGVAGGVAGGVMGGVIEDRKVFEWAQAPAPPRAMTRAL